jgi:hypothetical protein
MARPMETRILTTGSPQETGGFYVITPKAILADEVQASNLFEDLKQGILDLDHLRSQVRRAMEILKLDYNRIMPRTRLRLRPWSLKKGHPPYAVYWIFVNRRRPYAETLLDQVIENMKPRRFVRFKVGDRERLHWGIYHGGLAEHRRTVQAYDRRAAALNEAHRRAARGLDSLRKILSRRPEDELRGDLIPDLPRACWTDSCPWELHRLYTFAWIWVHFVAGTTRSLRVLAERLAGERLPRGLTLKFRQDAEHPYGQILWSGAGGRSSFARLTGRETRNLKLRSGDRKIIAQIERERRPLVRRLGCLTRLLKKVRMKTMTAIRQTGHALDRAFDGWCPYPEIPTGVAKMGGRF